MDLNTILIIAGVVVLIGLVAHGLWANRREKSKYFESANAFERDAEQAATMQQQNIAAAQTVNRPAFTESPPMSQVIPNVVTQEAALNPSEEYPQSGRQPLQVDMQPEYKQPSYVDNGIAQTAQTASSEIPNQPQMQMVQPQSVEQIKITLPDSPPPEIQEEHTGESEYSARLKQNTAQVTTAETESFDEEINTLSAQLRVQLQDSTQENSQTSFEQEKTPQEADQSNQKATFITLYVVAAENCTFHGVELEQELEHLGFKLGQDKLYHRHLTLDETSPVLFSVANITHPGKFEQHRIFEFSTQGVVLFMRLPSVGDDRVNLKMMIRAADHLAKTLHGFVLTDRQEIFTEQAEEEYLARLD